MIEDLMRFAESKDIARRLLVKKAKLFLGSVYILTSFYGLLYFGMSFEYEAFSIIMSLVFISLIATSLYSFFKVRSSYKLILQLEKIDGNELEEGLRKSLYFLTAINVASPLIVMNPIERSFLIMSLAETWALYTIVGLKVRSGLPDYAVLISPLFVPFSLICHWSLIGFSLMWALIGVKMVIESWKREE